MILIGSFCFLKKNCPCSYLAIHPLFLSVAHCKDVQERLKTSENVFKREGRNAETLADAAKRLSVETET